MPEALAMAAVAATATERPVVGTGVLQLPLRRAAVVAKAATTIDALSGGRFVLGVGVGEHEAEYERAGASFRTRGRTLDAGIDALRELWRPAGEGWFEQRPHPGAIPIWVGGRSPAAIGRAAQRADGWMPIFVTPDQFASANAQLDGALDAAGRSRSSVVRAVTLVVAIADGPAGVDEATSWCSELWNLPPERIGKHLVAGSASQVLEAIEAYRALGAEHVSILPATQDPVGLTAALASALR
jgi:alkanesulfonate monooxygenase SsuD/methylene tetrahydromethanopterin reductase-like flavin-dependent oxidoreductase (luciferase family)